MLSEKLDLNKDVTDKLTDRNENIQKAFHELNLKHNISVQELALIQNLYDKLQKQ
jgi:hypothetical protein